MWNLWRGASQSYRGIEGEAASQVLFGVTKKTRRRRKRKEKERKIESASLPGCIIGLPVKKKPTKSLPESPRRRSGPPDFRRQMQSPLEVVILQRIQHFQVPKEGVPKSDRKIRPP